MTLKGLVGGSDVFLAKYSADGAHMWSTRFGGSGDQWGTSVKTDSAGNVVLVGFLSGVGSIDLGGGAIASPNGSNSFAAKFAPLGAHLWSKGFGDQSGALAYDLTVDGAGNAIVTGQFTGTLDLDSGPLTSAGDSDIFVANTTVANFFRAFAGSRSRQLADRGCCGGSKDSGAASLRRHGPSPGER